MAKHDDLLEQAMGKQQASIDHQVRLARKRIKDVPRTTGKCHYCEEPVDPGKRFCDKECAEDAERYGLA